MTEKFDDEQLNDEGLPVEGPSGAEYRVLNGDEVTYYQDVKARYIDHNSFSNMSDLQELDRIMMAELLCWRWSNWLSTEKDYWDEPVDVQELNKRWKDTSAEIGRMKKNLGIDKSSRDKDRGTSLAEMIENLGRRAMEFGYHREHQFERGMILINELIALVTLNKNADEIEKKELHCTDADILEWMRSVMIPEYEEIDRHFKQNVQRFWVRDL